MKCQSCDEPATLHVTEIVHGEAVEYHVCEAHLGDLPSDKQAAGKGVAEPGADIHAAFQDPDARQKVAAFLLPALCLALLDEKPEVRIVAVYRIMMLGGDARSASGALRDALADPDERVCRLAEIALKVVESGQVRPWRF
jgi:hypothetical protein